MIFGDEPFQIQQCRQLIKNATKQQQFEEVIRLVDDDQFDWQSLYQHCQSMSLFAEKQLIELELHSGKVPKANGDILQDILPQLGEDTILVLFGPKLESSQTKTAWFKALDKAGLYIPVYEIDGQHLNRWLQQQMQQSQVQLAPDAQQFLLTYTSGNLLACAQELEKLALLFPNQLITLQQLESVLQDQSRYTVFQLLDTLLKRNAELCISILGQLKIEELEPNIIIWGLKKELSTIQAIQQANLYNLPVNDVFSEYKVWKNKQSLYLQLANQVPENVVSNCLSKLSSVDIINKSEPNICSYTLLAHICILFCGGQLPLEWPFPEISYY
jgi:DNA polymerase-3 subunit delta